MEQILSIINVIGVIGATIISAITLYSTKTLQTMQQKVNVMANKRSERIDKMREYSASIISNAKLFLYGISTNESKVNLISAVDKFISLLQYQYVHDIELVDCANEITKLCLSANLNHDELKKQIESFWKMCDLYIGVEYERLKLESHGTFNGSGEITKETNTFEAIYEKLSKRQDD